ncbi:MAG: hypothetical protein WA919_25970 [Coleofasciculaceae cyanobacterium]
MKFTKLKYSFLISLVFILLNSSTASSNEDVHNAQELAQLDNSLNVWTRKKEQHNDSYAYTVEFASWVGFRYKTTLIVKEGNIVERHYIAYNYSRDTITTAPEIKFIKKWSEVIQDELGSNDEGAPLKLIGELYNECRDLLLTKNKLENHIYFSLDKNGILKTCQYAPVNCADDCSMGVSIDSLEFPGNAE